MAVDEKKVLLRRKLAAKPQPDFNMKAIRAELIDRYKKTLEYLGR